MKDLRLIPLVVIAALGLLAMKAIEIFATGSVLVSGASKTTVADARPNTPRNSNLLKSWDVSTIVDQGVDPFSTGSSGHDAPPPEGAPEAAKPELKPSEVKVNVTDQRPKEAAPLGGANTDMSAEARLLERLGERRKQIEDREKQIDVREGLLKATEDKIEKRIDDLKSMEDKIGSGVKTREETKQKELADLVKMYESMKAKDAARVFDRLDGALLVDIARQMSPKKLADVVAKMQPDTAEKLTVGLANRRAKEPASTQGIDLPKIDGNNS